MYPNLKWQLYVRGLRQNRLAQMLGIDEAALSRIINGFRDPSRELRSQMASLLEANEEWLFDRYVDDHKIGALRRVAQRD